VLPGRGTIVTAAPAAESATSGFSTARRIYVVAMMMVISVIHSMDRMVITVIVVPIQKEFGVSDTAMGMLTGGAFALFYATAGIPLARYADVGNRRNLIGAAVTIWSAATMLCGLATGYVSLLLARLGVATAEAGSRPASISILADLFDTHRRATVVSIMMVGAGIGIMLGSAIGGAVSAVHGWRAALLIVGAPGIAVGILFLLTVPEPARESAAASTGAPSDSFWRTVGFIFRTPTFPFLVAGSSLYNMAQLASVAWMPTFLVRAYHLDGATVGLWYGIAMGVGGILGNLAGGLVTDWLSRRGAAWYMLIPMLSAMLQIPIAGMMVFGGSTTLAIIGLFLLSMVGYFTFGATTVGAIQIVRPRMRAVVSSMLFFCAIIVGLGSGPVVVGSISDWLTPTLGPAALGYALLVTPIVHFFAALLFFRASRTIQADVDRAAADSPAQA
jgi:predicted MFS family arabinose efflux permease